MSSIRNRLLPVQVPIRVVETEDEIPERISSLTNKGMVPKKGLEPLEFGTSLRLKKILPSIEYNKLTHFSIDSTLSTRTFVYTRFPLAFTPSRHSQAVSDDTTKSGVANDYF